MLVYGVPGIQLTGRGGGGGGGGISRRGDDCGGRCGYRAGNIARPDSVSVSLADGGCDSLGLGTCSPGASLGGVCDTLDDDGLDELGAGDGLRVPGRIEEGAAGTALALESLRASLQEAVGGAALDLGDETGLLGDGGEACGSGNGDGWGGRGRGRVSLGVGLCDDVCCGEVRGAFSSVSIFRLL